MKISILLLLSTFVLPMISFGQNNNAPSSYDIHDITITGYLQTQYQKSQSPGISSFSGGDFPTNSENRFMIRRGRLKIDRVDKYTSIVFQLDATQDGVQLMDAFIQLKEPKNKSLLLTAGLFNRPFGYSIIYSSGYRDFPERARVFQTLMPRERDIGFLIGYHPHKIAKFLTLEFAVVNGSGKNAKDYDSKKDYIGNVTFKFDSLDNKKLHIGFGGSIYQGSVRNNTTTYYTLGDAGFIVNSSDDYVGKNMDRKYYGGNFQLQYDGNFGTTSLKGEYVGGRQPGVAADGLDKLKGPYASQSFGTQPLDKIYERVFNGYYLWFTQQIAKTGLSALLAFDVYDPNTKVSNKTIGMADNFTTDGDVKFSTLGYGLAYKINQRIKLSIYNEQVKNETTSLKNYGNDIRDNVFTARIQYRW